MSAFYKFVIFKNDEFIVEINKSRQAQTALRVGRDHKESEYGSQKALFIVGLSVKKPM